MTEKNGTAEKGRGGALGAGLLGGAIVGGIAAVLLTPKSGAETRSILSERSAPLRSRAEELLGPAIERTRGRMAPLTDRIRSRFGRGGSDREEDLQPTIGMSETGLDDPKQEGAG